MHTKQKGNIAESATILALAKLGYNVFKEIGDLSRIDLLAEKNGRVIRIQCKGSTPKNGKLTLCLKKSGPNYQFYYNFDDFDFFALVDLTTLEVAFIPNVILKTHKAQLTLRTTNDTANQQKHMNYFVDYIDINRLLRDYTQGTSNCEDIVQTTTNENLASES